MSSPRQVLEASAAAHQRGDNAALAVVVDTEGSTYVRAGAMALFGARDGQVGWLSGGCLEPEIEARAQLAAAHARIEWMDIDTRDDEDLMGGSALGCRGRLHLALLPVASLVEWPALVRAWRNGEGALGLSIAGTGTVIGSVGAKRHTAHIDTASSSSRSWQVQLPPPRRILVLGAGPETPTLLPLLRTLGWMSTLVERRPRWLPEARHADALIELAPESALSACSGEAFHAGLVMHHNFEMDREALYALAATTISFIGLLGPGRRREDLFRVLPASMHEALLPRLHSPVGLKLGGQGPEAIALSIAAQLQALRLPQ
ncbi:MAG: XdhC family protein [Pseudoxanthomonas sp.]